MLKTKFINAVLLFNKCKGKIKYINVNKEKIIKMEDRQSNIKVTDFPAVANHTAILFKVLKGENFPEMKKELNLHIKGAHKSQRKKMI